MAKAFEKYQKRKLITSYFSVTLSISLVLLLMGVLGILILNTQKLGDHFKEQINIAVFLKDSAKSVEIKQLQQSLAMAEYTKSAVFVSKETAAEEQAEAIGENFMEFLGYNPLKNAIDLSLKADFVTPDQVAEIAKTISDKSFVEEVSYDKPLIDLLNDNIKKLSLWILIISAVFTFIAVLLINSSIRLSLYAKRFIIKTMQMVGATKGFIRKPFILTHIKLGLLGAFIASAGVWGILYTLNNSFPELNLLQDIPMLTILFAGIFGGGILISWVSTYFAAQRFLNLRTSDLYY
jgi:cell division transport system permease protein